MQKISKLKGVRQYSITLELPHTIDFTDKVEKSYGESTLEWIESPETCGCWNAEHPAIAPELPNEKLLEREIKQKVKAGDCRVEKHCHFWLKEVVYEEN